MKSFTEGLKAVGSLFNVTLTAILSFNANLDMILSFHVTLRILLVLFTFALNVLNVTSAMSLELFNFASNVLKVNLTMIPSFDVTFTMLHKAFYIL